MKDVVIGATSGYSYEQVECWVNSLDQSGFTGDKIMIIGNASLRLVRELTARGFHVVTRWSREEPSGYRYTNPTFVDHDMSIERFSLMWEFLRQTQENAYRYVISVDTRDAIFQSNPSSWLEEHLGDKRLLVSGEGLRYEDEEWNSRSMNEAFGPSVYSHMAKKTIWNCGTIAGDFHIFRDLCLNIYLCCIGRNVPYSDQAALNLLLSLDPFRGLTRFDIGDHGWACQSGTMVDLGCVRDHESKYLGVKPVLDGDVIRTSSGKKFCIVHQYDRVPEWNTIFQGKYSGSSLYPSGSSGPRQSDPQPPNWHLNVYEGSEASLLSSSDGEHGEVLRVDITKSETSTTWHIQLNQVHHTAHAYHHYRVAFRARADSGRHIFLGFAKAHEPWSDLGLYKCLQLGPDWRNYEEEFVATADDNNARILFDLGGSAVSTEFASVTLSEIEPSSQTR